MEMPRLIALCIAASAAASAFADAPRLVKLWESEPTFKVPESVLYDAKRKVLYISNIDGEPWGDDGQGSIGKLGLDGEVIDAEWVEGLSAPKGMGVSGKRLYVADMNRVVVIDIAAGKIEKRIDIPGAATLNDVSVGKNGVVYVTDSKLGNIHKLVDGKPTLVVEGRKGLNGVLSSNGELLFVDSGALYLVGKDGEPEEIGGGMEGHTDGIERVDDDTWLVSCWAGTVYHVTRDGAVTLLLDGRPTETSAADLGYDPKNRIAYFPGFFKNFVAAYKLEL